MHRPVIKIADAVSFPLEVVTQSIAVLAKKRAGKSHLARRFMEQLLEAGQQVVIVDPKGDTWGIRSSGDGKRAGYPVIVLGGEHGDLPLEPTAGELVAKLVVEERVSVLLDLSRFRKHEVATFMGGVLRGSEGFLEALYRLKAQERFRDAMTLIVDEADAIAPQKPQQGEERMLGAMQDIIRRGGQRGIGSLLVTQRSAVLSKDVLTQSQILIALRTIAPQDLQAIEPWFKVHGLDEQLKIVMQSLPSLPIGDAWFSSPGWPTDAGLFIRGHVLPITTFDSGATPKPGEKRTEPKTLADVNLDALRRQMAETLEKAKAEDPRELRRQIAELKKQVAKPTSPDPAPSKEISADKLQAQFDKGVQAERKRIRSEIGKRLDTLGKLLRKVLPIQINYTTPTGNHSAALGVELLAELDAAIAGARQNCADASSFPGCASAQSSGSLAR